jgi:hypothetical protein
MLPTNTLSANDIRRRGMAAIVDGLKRGPVHIIENDKPTAVVLTEEEYARLLGADVGRTGAGDTPVQSSALRYLLDLPPGKRSLEAVRADIERERAGWDEA